MSNKLDPEQERLVRLRERQLSVRDPGIKKRKFDHMISEKERRTKNSISIGRVWNAIPNIWRGAFIGLILGLITFGVLPTLWISDMSLIVSVVAAAVLIVLGVLIGSALDYRDELRDLSK